MILWSVLVRILGREWNLFPTDALLKNREIRFIAQENVQNDEKMDR